MAGQDNQGSNNRGSAANEQDQKQKANMTNEGGTSPDQNAAKIAADKAKDEKARNPDARPASTDAKQDKDGAGRTGGNKGGASNQGTKPIDQRSSTR